MRKILDVLRLSLEGGRSHREIARAINASPTTVGDLLRRAKLYGITWPLPAGMSEPAAGGAAVPAGGTVEPDPPRTRLADRAPRTAAQGRHPRPPLAGIQRPNTRPAIATAASAPSTVSGSGGSRSACARRIPRARNCSSTTPARRCRSPIPRAAKSGRRRSSSPSSVPPTTPTAKPPGARVCRTGSAAMCAPSNTSAASRPWWCPTTSRAASPPPATTSPNSTRPTATWPLITAPRFYPPGRVARKTRPRPRPGCFWSSAGSWRVCATSVSSAWLSSTAASPN
jgi:hypothetical protein